MSLKIFALCSLLVGFVVADDASEFIIGGSDASLGQFKHMASIRYQLSPGSAESRHGCGGGVLNARWVLTAAHCLKTPPGVTFMNPLFVVVGAVRLDEPGEVYRIARTFPHPQYSFTANRFSNWHDIGLVQVATDIVFTDYVQPIPINRRTIGFPTPAVLSGYGHYSLDLEEIRVSNHLQYKNTTILTHVDCVLRTALAGVVVPEYRPLIYPGHICTLAQRGIGGCFGDSGSVLVANGGAVGVVSFGLSCARGAPDLLARVSSYTRWLDLTMRMN